nr:transposase (putative), gypsy type [Tanacetum cinerariifolium]
MSFSKRPERNTPQCYTKPLDSLKNWNNRFFWVDKRVFPIVVDWRTNAPKDGMPAEGTYSIEAVRVLDTHRTPIPKQPEMLLCLVRISRRYYLGDELYPTFLHDDDQDMDLFNLIRAPNPTKVKTKAVKEAALGLMLTPPQSHCEGIMLILDPQGDPMGEKVLLPYNWVWLLLLLCLKMLLWASVTQIRYPLLMLHHAVPLTLPSKSSPGIAAAGDPKSENASSPAEVGSPGSVYQPEWGVTNGSLLDTLEACQDLVDHVAPPGYFSELHHMHNEEFLGQYNVNLARQVAMWSQLRLRFEQEAKLLRKSVSQVARRDKRIQARELEIKNLEALLETEAGMKRAAKDKSAGLTKELEDMRARFSDLQAVFEEFKRYEDDRVERRCAELDARLDALSIDFDEELYPHMLTTIAGRRWVIGHGLRLAVIKCGESLDMRQAFADVVSAGITKGMSEALQALKDLKHPLLDQLEGLKDTPIDVIMASLYLESDTGEDAP